MLTFTKKNIIGYNKIYLISSKKDLTIDGAITIDENTLPITMDTISNKLGKNNRNGWYLQQLYKLYASIFIEEILDNYLVIDADTYFLKPTKFIDNESKYLFNIGTEYHRPYFSHMNKMHPTLKKTLKYSGITHHMIFNKKILEKLFYLVENNHNGKKFWEIFLESVDKNVINGSGASEYEIYFTYMLLYETDKIKIRPLNWKNSSKLIENSNYDYVSVHHYMRK
jgi:L-rhamnose mutarotase